MNKPNKLGGYLSMKKEKDWHYKLAEKIVNNLPEWKREIYDRVYSKDRHIKINTTIKCVCPYSDICSINRQNRQSHMRYIEVYHSVDECEFYKFFTTVKINRI